MNRSTTTSTTGVPVIDVTELDDPATLAALDAACRDWGFFQIVGHGVDRGVTDALLMQMRRFFALDGAAKRSLSRTAENPWGFYDQELTKNTRDWKEIFDYGPPEGAAVPQWPRDLPEFQLAVQSFYRAAEKLSFQLLTALSRNLGMAPDYLAGAFMPRHLSFLRLNYYPLCPAPARPERLDRPTHGHLGINHHTDAGALTVLLQDRQPGLEVYRYGDWHLIEPREDALVINIGDIVQVWSNDRYRASLHRVVASAAAERYSAPFFFNPAYATDYAPLPSAVDATHPARYRPINWGEFRAGRAAGDYADVGEEIQISQFRIEEDVA